MAVDVKNLIAAVNPDVYCDKTRNERGVPLNKEVAEIVKKEGYLKAAEKAKLIESEYMDVVDVQFTESPFQLNGIKNPTEQHRIVYDDFSQNLEPVYFWILDYVNEDYGESEKLIDNFLSSPGSGHFAEMSKRATVLQEEAMKIFGLANTVIRSVLNIIYDLKEFKLRLAQYDDLKSQDKRIKNAAMLSLKQIWMDSVDIKRGNSAIKVMAQQFDFVTLLDAFMSAESLEQIEKIDLNDRVKRIIQQRFSEFQRWFKESEIELRKRFEVEKIYLKSQVNSLKLYARWAKPYLKAARQLEQNALPNSSLVNAFNTSLFELVLLGKGKYEKNSDIEKGELPKSFKKIKTREYFPLTIVEFRFRTAPDRNDQRGGYGYRGKIEVRFTSFAFNEDELKVFKEKLAEDDFGEVYKAIEGATEDSLNQLKADLDELLEGKETKKEEKKSEDTNPFSALFSFLKKDEKKKEKDLSKGIPKDTSYEKVIRSQAILAARTKCRRLYNEYKKFHSMPSFPPTIS
ncbi:hypothetical protein HY450_02355 [Candidatus Pacearchaeota archaeon]|nr:hypothetical protein [Candidatus Pacearchaeota archaeon]